ncbi:DNA topoisomerase 3-alpha isoform X2 [Cryptomeria japonica]|uniref:DNA topoisomerase 3-alpha isoform X2 n=1 Tax=Cryptomeria japonica TaxID=3369 RepID=UPI0027D9D2F2|nr:DNA topoisomerase 3-alpha isoform X2 [Cryptomeria japonica]
MEIRVLNVAEKPSVAKTVAQILSHNNCQTRDGRSRYNKIFEFKYMINNQRCHMLMTSVTGHLMELDFHDQYRKWHSCDPTVLYTAPVRKYVPQEKQELKMTLEEEARRCQWLVLWLDCDMEGENIAFEVIDVCQASNPHLHIRRAHFSALIERDIHEAVQRLGQPNRFFTDAVDARQEIDLRIGASFTRFQTMLLQDAFLLPSSEDERKLVLSYGPCQFPTLGFVVERYWEIQAHEPEEYWTINCSHTSEDSTATFNWARGHLFDYACAVIIYEMCVEEPTATVTNVIHQERRKYPPYPLSTIELQKRASHYFRMSSERTMKVAEELYQWGFISYPRTETDHFSENADLQAIVRDQQEHPVWGTYAQRLLNPEEDLWRNPGNGGHDDKAHPPIHPTKFSAGESNWSPDHKKLYELVVRHFLACVSQPALGAGTTVDIDIAGEKFSASGLMIIMKNYLEIYKYESWGGSVIPTFIRGQQFVPTRLTLDASVTRPPPLLSEADLLGCMDKAGIGTDATMHDHIKKLLDRCYVTKDPNTRFCPTNLGEALVMGYDAMGYELWKPYLRAMMEGDMKAAKSNKEKLFEAMELFFERSQRQGGGEQHAVGEIVCHCKLCQASDMVLKKKPDGKFMVGCLNFPLCRNVVWLPGAISEAVVTNQSCNTCVPDHIFKIQFKFRRMEIPAQYSTEHLGCIGGCDGILKELIEICGTGPARGRQPAQAPVNSRQSACRNCGQPGHSSNECPQLPRGRPSVNSSRGGRASSSRGRAPSTRGGRANRTSSTSSRGRRQGNGSFVSATGEQLSAGDRRCFVCGDPSHFANACPNRA